MMMRSGAAVLVGMLMVFVSGCGGESEASLGGAALGAGPVEGALCEIVLRPDVLEGWDDSFITPGPTRDNAVGSKDSVWGKYVAMHDDWIVVDMADILMDKEDGSVTTYGEAGIKQTYRYWVPRERVLYFRVWTE